VIIEPRLWRDRADRSTTWLADEVLTKDNALVDAIATRGLSSSCSNGPARSPRRLGMKCPRCQQENPQEAQFCEECATPLARICSNCGTALSATAKFCHACAHPVASAAGTPSRSPDSYIPKHLVEKILSSKAALEGERKKVTVLFADLKGSMELLADRDPEEARKLLDPVLERMMEAVHRYEGTVNQVIVPPRSVITQTSPTNWSAAHRGGHHRGDRRGHERISQRRPSRQLGRPLS
jgi:Double zinc ribbon